MHKQAHNTVRTHCKQTQCVSWVVIVSSHVNRKRVAGPNDLSSDLLKLQHTENNTSDMLKIHTHTSHVSACMHVGVDLWSVCVHVCGELCEEEAAIQTNLRLVLEKEATSW